jgi:AcrR family transcriptional regulator
MGMTMPRPMTDRARQRAEVNAGQPSSARRDEIAGMACRVFAERGFQNTTMRDLADEIGIKAGSLYHHFSSKDEILAETLRRFFDDAVRDLGEIADRPDDVSEVIHDLFALAFRYVVERRDEARIVQNDFPYLEQIPAFRFVADGAVEVERIWERVLARGVDGGQLRGDLDLPTVYRTIMGAMFSSVRWYEPSGRLPIEELVRQQTALYLDGLTAKGAESR